MRGDIKRGAGAGLIFGVIAGLIFGTMEIVGAALMGNPPLMPVKMFASVVLGRGALESEAGGTFLVGVVAHLVLSAAFGLVYGLIHSPASEETRTRWGRQAGIGLLFGVVLWILNFQVIARILYPWFLTTPQILQMLMHAMFFGLPLGLMYAASERRVRHARRVPTHI